METKSDRYQKMMNIADLMASSNLAGLMKKGLLINELNMKLSRLFPFEFHGLFRCGGITQDTLFIEVKSAVVRQGILFRQNELIMFIQQSYPEVKRLNVKFNPDF